MAGPHISGQLQAFGRLLKRAGLFLPALALFGAIATVIFVDVYVARTEYNQNYAIVNYESSKLFDPRYRDTKIVFVGDSSCGNAINASAYSRLAGAKATNLCLTGSFGIAGSLVMARAAVRRFPELRQVVLIQTPDIWWRPFKSEGYFLTSVLTHTFVPTPRFGVADLLLPLLDVRTAVRALKLPTRINYPEWGRGIDRGEDVDYLRQSPEGQESAGGRDLWPDPEADPDASLDESIHADKVEALKDFDDFCRANRARVSCAFALGPIIDAYPKRSPGHFDRIRAAPRRNQWLRFVDEVFSYDASWFGNSIDHVAPSKKTTVTEDYFRALNPRVEPTHD